VRKLLKTSPRAASSKFWKKKHTVGNRLVFEKNQIPGQRCTRPSETIPVLLSHSSLSLFLTGRRLKVFLTNLGALGQRVQNISTSLRAFGQRLQKYFNKSWGIWNCGNIYSMKKKKTGRAFYFVE
jgi:hypothetical protein